MTRCFLFETYQQFPKPVQPRQGTLDDPSASLVAWIALLGTHFFSSLTDMGDVLPALHGFARRLARIPLISAQMLLGGFLSLRSFYHNVIQGRLQELYIMPLGSAHDQG